MALDYRSNGVGSEQLFDGRLAVAAHEPQDIGVNHDVVHANRAGQLQALE